MLSKLKFEEYRRVIFVYAVTDTWTPTKLNAFYDDLGVDLKKVSNLRTEQIYRSREVKQSYLTSILSTMRAFIEATVIIFKY